MKVILVGRHVSDLPLAIEVIEQKNILWSTDYQECYRQFDALNIEAQENKATILLQNIPGILGAVLFAYAKGLGVAEHKGMPHTQPKIGVIISVPGERKAQEERGMLFEDKNAAEQAAILVKHANARAKVEILEPENFMSTVVTVTVDPVPEFVFSHIEWF